MVTGSSWTTAGTLGVAFVGMAKVMGLSEAAAAGAVICGAYFGDKMSPLSETTILVPKLVGRGLTTSQHISNMFWTAGPAIGISLLIFLVIGLTAEPAGGVSTQAAIDTLEADVQHQRPQPAAAGAARAVHDQEGTAVPCDSRIGAVRGHPRVLHPVDGREGVRRRPGPRTGGHRHQGDLRGDGDRIREQERQPRNRPALLPWRDGQPPDDRLARPGGALLRRDHGARRLSRAAPPADRRTRPVARASHRRRHRQRRRAERDRRRPVRRRRAAGPDVPRRVRATRARAAGARARGRGLRHGDLGPGAVEHLRRLHLGRARRVDRLLLPVLLLQLHQPDPRRRCTGSSASRFPRRRRRWRRRRRG